METLTSIYRSGRRYQSLRVISGIFILVGVLLMVSGGVFLAFGVSALMNGPVPLPPRGAEPSPFLPQLGAGPFGGSPRAWFYLYVAIAFLFSGLQAVVVGTLCRLAIQLEENTRASAQFLDRIRRRLEAGGDAVEPFLRG